MSIGWTTTWIVFVFFKRVFTAQYIFILCGMWNIEINMWPAQCSQYIEIIGGIQEWLSCENPRNCEIVLDSQINPIYRKNIFMRAQNIFWWNLSHSVSIVFALSHCPGKNFAHSMHIAHAHVQLSTHENIFWCIGIILSICGYVTSSEKFCSNNWNRLSLISSLLKGSNQNSLKIFNFDSHRLGKRYRAVISQRSERECCQWPK